MSVRSVAGKNDTFVHLHFLIISPYPYFNLFPEHNFATGRNISMIHGGFIEQINAEFHLQECNLCLSTVFIQLPPLIHIFKFIF